MFCQHCGKPVNSDSAFCGNCGAPMNPVPAAAPRPQPQPQPQTYYSGYPTAAPTTQSPEYGFGYPAAPVNTPPKPSALTNIVNSAFALLSSALVFLIFLIPVQITTGSFYSTGVNRKLVFTGYDIVGNQDKLTAWWGKSASIAITISIVVLCCAGFLALVAAASFFIKKGNKIICIIVIVLNTVFGVLYYIEGVLAVNLCSPRFSPESRSYFALIIFGAFVVLYIAAMIWLSIRRKKTAAYAQPAPAMYPQS